MRWHATTTDLARSLPDLATMLHHAIRAGLERRLLYVLDAQFDGTVVVRGPTWTLATTQTPALQRLITASKEIRSASDLVNDTLNVTPYPGVHETGRSPLSPRLPADPGLPADESGPIAQMIRQLARTNATLPTPLPPAAASLDARARRTARRKTDNTKISVSFAREVVAEVQTLASAIDRLQAEIDRLSKVVAWDTIDMAVGPDRRLVHDDFAGGADRDHNNVQAETEDVEPT
jgi:hypothetical protein